MKQNKCPCCGEKVYEVIIKGTKKYGIVREKYIPPTTFVFYWMEHTCYIPKKLQVEK